MTSLAHLRKGWCPGALRPMRSGDGLVVRVRPRAGAFSLTALREISAIASRFGSGEIDLTNRGNLQLRGVSEGTLGATLQVLDEVGLLDRSADAEAVRNVIVDPLSGLDPEKFNVRDLAAEFESLLVQDHRFWALPTKFGFSFSGSADTRVGGRSTDIMISTDAGRFFIHLDGSTDAHCEVSRDDVVATARRLASVFVEITAEADDVRRMRHAVAALGASAIFAMAGLRVSDNVLPSKGDRRVSVGLLASNGTAFAVGIGLPFGRTSAEQLSGLCDVASAANVEYVHTSPQRVLYFPLTSSADGLALLRSADSSGLITRNDDIRLMMDVCPGSPACKNANTDTRRDAQYFADTFGGSLDGRSLHISGCEKGCARHTSASFTFVGRGGHYDLIRNGSASSTDVLETVEADGIGAAISRLIAESAA